MTKCLVVLVLTLALTACAGAHSAAPSLSPARAHRVAPPATQRVDTHGIEIAVPARWRLGRGVCGTPKANTGWVSRLVSDAHYLGGFLPYAE